MSDGLFPGEKRALRPPGTEWRRRALFGQVAVLTDSLTEAGLWPLQRWTGRLDRYAHLAGLGLSAWFKEIYSPTIEHLAWDPSPILARLFPKEGGTVTRTNPLTGVVDTPKNLSLVRKT